MNANGTIHRFFLVSAISIASGTGAFAIEVLKAEPSAGTLPFQQHVLVDDGTCPKGEIKQIVGGNGLAIKRQKSCVKRPKGA